ncbi:MAG: hypothetical protein P4L55_21185 [Syntrophobacteraceae bacterium]|nr:hypothetical protein [Syntrophobacteraceae bacterium]
MASYAQMCEMDESKKTLSSRYKARGKVLAPSKWGYGLDNAVVAFMKLPEFDALQKPRSVEIELWASGSTSILETFVQACTKRSYSSTDVVSWVNTLSKSQDRTDTSHDEVVTLLTEKVTSFSKDIKSIDSCWIKIDSISKTIIIYTVTTNIDFSIETKIFQELYADIIYSLTAFYVESRITILEPDRNLNIPSGFTPIYRSSH